MASNNNKYSKEKASATDATDDGITGTLASTVGVKNPYRYRGYRYDSETGLYYLQSRYYNPEWGRFINADALVGATGDLLGHNMFSYCKNNPINFCDPSGFLRELVMDDAGNYSNGWDGAAHHGSSPTASVSHSVISDITKSAIAGGTDKAVGDLTMECAKTTHYEIYRTMEGNHTVRRAYIRDIPKYQRYTEFVPGGVKGGVARFSSKFGILGATSLSVSVDDDFNSYDSYSAWGAAGVDCGWFLGGAAMVALIPVETPILLALGGTMLVGATTSAAADVTKKYLFKKKK